MVRLVALGPPAIGEGLALLKILTYHTDPSISHGNDGATESSKPTPGGNGSTLESHLKFDLNGGYYGEIQRMHTAKGNLSAVISKERAYATAPV